jgi:hypothetical protein
MARSFTRPACGHVLRTCRRPSDRVPTSLRHNKLAFRNCRRDGALLGSGWRSHRDVVNAIWGGKIGEPDDSSQVCEVRITHYYGVPQAYVHETGARSVCQLWRCSVCQRGYNRNYREHLFTSDSCRWCAGVLLRKRNIDAASGGHLSSFGDRKSIH